jgi:hypothetical protein
MVRSSFDLAAKQLANSIISSFKAVGGEGPIVDFMNG